MHWQLLLLRSCAFDAANHRVQSLEDLVLLLTSIYSVQMSKRDTRKCNGTTSEQDCSRHKVEQTSHRHTAYTHIKHTYTRKQEYKTVPDSMLVILLPILLVDISNSRIASIDVPTAFMSASGHGTTRGMLADSKRV